MNATKPNGQKSLLDRIMGPDPDPKQHPHLYHIDQRLKRVGINSNFRLLVAIVVLLAILAGVIVAIIKVNGGN